MQSIDRNVFYYKPVFPVTLLIIFNKKQNKDRFDSKAINTNCA